jgi:hypothetical protein
MEAIYSSESSVDFQRNAWRFIPEDRTLHDHHCENLKSYIINNIYSDLRSMMQDKKINSVAYLLRLLLSNGSINKSQQRDCFL